MEKIRGPHQENEKEKRFISERAVVKIGSRTITGGGDYPDPLFMDSIARQVVTLSEHGVQVYIVTSGAVACGRRYIPDYNGSADHRYWAAALGQSDLMYEWRSRFADYGMPVGQFLLTERDLPCVADRLRHFPYGIPIINANDPVNSTELNQLSISADNDCLAGYVATSVEADTVFLLTNVPGVSDIFDQTIKLIDVHNLHNYTLANSGVSEGGTGGMASKHGVAVDLATKNIRTIIGNGREADILLAGAQGDLVGTTYVCP